LCPTTKALERDMGSATWNIKSLQERSVENGNLGAGVRITLIEIIERLDIWAFFTV
jgi:hypothetical protein